MSQRNRWIGSLLLVSTVILTLLVLAFWKRFSIQEAAAAGANHPEPMESISAATAREVEHRRTTTSIGTVTALRSITLRNEIAGTVRQVILNSGQIVDKGTLLVALDVSVEEADLREQEAQAALAESSLARIQSVGTARAVSELEVDRARAEVDVARAKVARTKAVIERKMIRAPFRSRVGISDVHPGQYLNEGTELTTLQGVDDSAYVDFAVAQQVAAALQKDNKVEVFTAKDNAKIAAKIVAVDARVDPSTRNATVRARIDNAANILSPGASVRVEVPDGPVFKSVAVPVSALRKGPGGDHVFVILQDKDGKTRAHIRQVESGIILGDDVLIHKGLSAGEQVAASGSFKLREAVLVSVSDSTNIPKEQY